MQNAILIINAGSSSIKFAGYAVDGEKAPALLGKGQVEGLRTEPSFVCRNPAGEVLGEHRWPDAITHGEAIDYIIGWIEEHAKNARVAAAGMRGRYHPPRAPRPR